MYATLITKVSLRLFSRRVSIIILLRNNLILCGLDERCSESTPDSWIKYTNSRVHGGIATRDSDLDSCQASCMRNSSCTRLDWSPRASVGQRCWLHGHWSSSQSRRPANGVTHYELRRTAVVQWVKYRDMHVLRGIASDATDLAGCQKACVNNASCTRLDWNARASVGQRCWLHGHWSSSESRRPSNGVIHYEIRRVAGGNWVKYPDMHVPGGIPTTATDLAGCQDACINNASCTRIDWASAPRAGQRCWIHGPWSSSGTRRSAQGVMHLELNRGGDGFCGE